MRFVLTFVLKYIQRLCTRSNPRRHTVGSAPAAEDSILWLPCDRRHSSLFGIQHHITIRDWCGCEQWWSVLLEQVNQATMLLPCIHCAIQSHTYLCGCCRSSWGDLKPLELFLCW